MAVIDLILNVAALLLWLNGRSAGMPSVVDLPGKSLSSTLHRAHAANARGWPSYVGVMVILSVRSIFYWQIGPALNWTAMLDLEVVSIPFRSDFLGRMFQYSLLSFFRLWLLMQAGIVLLSLLQKGEPNGPAPRMVAWQLGRIHRWPGAIKLVLPWGGGGIAWWLVSWTLLGAGLMDEPGTAWLQLQQAAILGLAVYLAWVPLVAGLFLIYLVESHVHLGRFAIWEYLRSCARTMLDRLEWLPARVGRLDFKPLICAALVLGLGHLARLWLETLHPVFTP